MTQRRKRIHRCGSTLVELVVSTILVGVLMAASLTATGQSLLNQSRSADRVAARYLADSLLQEILAKEYQEPDGASLLGVDLLETLGLRSSYDDVDDYHGHTESPPTSANGSALSGYGGWSRTVQVIWLDPVTLAPTGSSNTGVKQISVSVSLGGVALYTALGCKADI